MKRSQIKRRPMAEEVLAGLEPEAKEYRELDGNGLYLRYKTPSGKWSWLGLGPYGSGSHQFTGAQARKNDILYSDTLLSSISHMRIALIITPPLTLGGRAPRQLA